MSHQLGRIKAIFMDMDDTLVMTGDADVKAYSDVVKLAKELHAQVCIHLLAHWMLACLAVPGEKGVV